MPLLCVQPAQIGQLHKIGRKFGLEHEVVGHGVLAGPEEEADAGYLHKTHLPKLSRLN